MRTPFLVTLSGGRNTIENVESGLAVHLAEQAKRVAVRLRTDLILRLRLGRRAGGRRQGIQNPTETILPVFLEASYMELLGW